MKKKQDAPEAPRYRVLNEMLSYGERPNVWRGSVVNDIPAASVAWLLADNEIEPADGSELFDAPDPSPTPAGDSL